jgi:hypothetical protein
MIVLLVTGTRRELSHPDQRKVSNVIDDVAAYVRRNTRACLIIGDCPTGVDHFALWYFGRVRTGRDHPELLTEHVYKADWDAYGNAAGPKRNQQMVDDGLALKRLFSAELHCLAFPAPDSRGTHDCARRAREAGYNVTFHPVRE